VALRYCGVSVLFCIVFGGYVLSVDKMIQDVPWVGWLAYTTPALYTYEAVMAAEFHNMNFSCATGSIIPSGVDQIYQTCAYAGSKIGSTIVNGDDYLAVKYGFYYSHVWRNFGILCLFTVVYIGLTCWLSEVMEWELDSAGPIQFKGSSKLLSRKKNSRCDEEKAPVSFDSTAPPAAHNSRSDQVLSATESTFSWSDLDLNVQIGKESRKLLDGVSGYCKPGSLTALVGASGAGKSTCKSLS
jgi:ATP-binding cassette subfamily G (WHITE) protein 2 (SNQ2)